MERINASAMVKITAAEFSAKYQSKKEVRDLLIFKNADDQLF